MTYKTFTITAQSNFKDRGTGTVSLSCGSCPPVPKTIREISDIMEKIKKLLFIISLILLIIFFAFNGQNFAFAISTNDIRVYIDAEEVKFPDTKPYILNSRTLVPVRTISEQLGATVKWDNSTRTVNIIKGDDVINIEIGYPRLTKNGSSYLMDTIATIKNGRTMVPLRFVSEQLGVGVEWVSETKTIQIRTDVNPKDIILTIPKKETVNNLILTMAKNNPIYIQGILIVNKSYPLPANYNPGENTVARSAFNKMQTRAKSEGLNIYISSGFRSYSYQTKVYNRYVKSHGQKVADTFSARPGHSEHQTGLALDLNSITDSFANTKEGIWVKNNCYKYGFIVRYPKGKESITGYQYEPWHIRYVGIDMATKIHNSGLCLEEYLGITSSY